MFHMKHFVDSTIMKLMFDFIICCFNKFEVVEAEYVYFRNEFE